MANIGMFERFLLLVNMGKTRRNESSCALLSVIMPYQELLLPMILAKISLYVVFICCCGKHLKSYWELLSSISWIQVSTELEEASNVEYAIRKKKKTTPTFWLTFIQNLLQNNKDGSSYVC
ncbi:uncharacterized protein LOC127144301 isoform X2 [Cucumis melo]|uniref:Uncharacterized protein LOC127144301 isoform X2 n=1 Tax=Cucumis melo TaxID=3656 RepID=A0ABM3KE58_CUCME|nr:uncharacterized protein LOC127144301 isoform X2 [Cucumis melo]